MSIPSLRHCIQELDSSLTSKCELCVLFEKTLIYVPKTNECEQNLSSSPFKIFVKARLENVKCMCYSSKAFFFTCFGLIFFLLLSIIPLKPTTLLQLISSKFFLI